MTRPFLLKECRSSTMLILATYVCQVRGLAGLEPPEPILLGQAAKVAKGIGVERLMLPVLEEALLGTSRAKVGFLDGLIEALNQVAEAKLTAWLIAPAQRVLGLDWVPPHLVRAVRDPQAGPVFVEGTIKNLRPLAQKNIWPNLTPTCSGCGITSGNRVDLALPKADNRP